MLYIFQFAIGTLMDDYLGKYLFYQPNDFLQYYSFS